MHQWSIQAVDEFSDRHMEDTHMLILRGALEVGDLAYEGGLDGWDISPLNAEGVAALGDASACYAVARLVLK